MTPAQSTPALSDTTLEPGQFSFGCYSRGAIWTQHMIEAASPDVAMQIHEQKFPHHQFQSAARVKKEGPGRDWRKKE